MENDMCIKVSQASGDGVHFVPPEKYSSSDAGGFHQYEQAYPVQNTISYTANVLVVLERASFDYYLRKKSACFEQVWSDQASRAIYSQTGSRPRLVPGKWRGFSNVRF